MCYVCIVTAQLNTTQVGVDKVLGWHVQATQEADFWYVTLF